MIKLNKPKRKYEEKLKPALLSQKRFLIENLKQEWREIEKQATREDKNTQLVKLAKDSGVVVGKTFLALLAVGGVLTVAAVAPNIFSAFGRSMNHKKFFNKKRLNQDKQYLKRLGYIKIKKIEEDVFEVQLTDKGLIKILEQSFDDLKIKKPEKWDGFWRVVIFDIPNRHKWAREGFRDRLRALGFYKLQESVFVMPYYCEKEIEFLVSVFNINSYVRLIKTVDLSNDIDLRQFYKL